MKRLASLPYLDDAAIHAEIEAALGTTRAYGFGGGSILCHGDAGNLETLLVASQVIATPLREEIMQRAGALLDSMPAEEGVTELP